MIHFIFASFVCRYRLLRSIGRMCRFYGYRKAIGAGRGGLPRWTYILVEALFATFAAKAAFTGAAKARRCIKQISAVDPHRSSWHVGGLVQGEVDVLAPYTGREPIARVVRQLYCLGGGAESHRYEHRSKDLDLGDGRGRGDVGKERRWEEVALGGTGPGWLPHYRALFDALSYTVQVGVIKYDEGGFTTQLEREFFARACCGTAEHATNIGRTGEGNLVYAGMEHEGITDLRGFTRQDVDHARRQADLLYYLGKFERGQRCVARGLQHDGIAHCQRGRDFPGKHEQGEIPGDDLPDDAHGFVAGEFRGHELRPACVIVEVAGDERDVEVARLADGLAIIH